VFIGGIESARLHERFEVQGAFRFPSRWISSWAGGAIVSGRVAELLLVRKLDVISGAPIIGAVAAVPDFGAGIPQNLDRVGACRSRFRMGTADKGGRGSVTARSQRCRVDIEKYPSLIHGIGNPKPGSVKRQARELLAKAGVPDDHVHEFNWNQHVAQPVTRGFLSPRNLSELCEALLNAAWLGFEREDRFFKTGVLLLELTLGLFPLFIAALLLKRYPDAARTIIPDECCSSLRRLPDILFHGWAFAVGCIAGLMSAIATIYRSGRLLAAAVRRVLLLVFWPLVHFLLLPFLIPWHFAALMAFTVITRSCIRFRVESISQPDYWLELLTGLALLIIVAVLIVGALVGAGVIAPQVKLIADVIRYLGLPAYRSGLHERLKTFIAGTDESRRSRLLLIAHSLGSVIAADFLSDPNCPLDHDADVCLITLGSPLRRFFARFFGQVYPPPAEIARSIRTRFPRFVWINIFRPLDYVGGRLSASAHDIQNICTGERLRFHTGYWGDDVVAAKAEVAWQRRNLIETQGALTAVTRAPRYPNLPARSATPGWVCLWLITASVAVGAGYLGYIDRTRWEPARYQRESTAAKARIDRDPVDVTGVLRRKFGVDRVGPPDNQEYIEYKLFELTFTPIGQGAAPVKARYSKFFKSVHVFAHLKWNGNEAPIRVRYSKNNSAEFYLPGEDPGDPEDVAVPLLAGFYSLLFRAAPLGALAWLVFVTLFGLLEPKI